MRRRSSLLSLGLLASCATSQPLPTVEHTPVVLTRVSRTPADYGDRIYEGTVFPLVGPHTTPTYVYERRVQRLPSGARSTSFTHDVDHPVLIEVAEHDGDATLRSFTEYQLQLGEVGRLVMEGHIAEFHLAKGDTERVVRETVSGPVVVGPTLYLFAKHHWAELMAGRVVPLRFAVMSRLETIGFELEKVDAPEGQVRVRMKAQSPFIELLVDPLFITWTSDGQLVSLDGRVPTKVKDGDGWGDLDAHVEYRNDTTTYE